ncbi:MAG: hypothetical protein HOQ38_12675, partial [Nonomuraea sp.]|nr:hypothetical protein [Nonomuraea sp.]
VPVPSGPDVRPGPPPPGMGTAETRDSRPRSRRRGALVGAAAVVTALLAVGGALLLIDRTPDPRNTLSDPPRSASASTASTPPPTQSPTQSPAESPAKSTGRTGALKIPAAFAGSWSGHTDSTNPLDADGADNTVELEAGRSEAAWTEKSRGSGCSATIVLTKVEPAKLTFSLGTSEGQCIPGTVWLELKDGALAYTWRDVPGLGMVTQTGDLRKK